VYFCSAPKVGKFVGGAKRKRGKMVLIGLKPFAPALKVLHAHAGGHPEGGGDGGKYGNYDVQDFAPDFFVHFLIYDL